MIISQGRKPLEFPESEELPRHVGWGWDGGNMPGWPRACGGGSQLLLRATLTGSGPEACSPNPPLGVLSVLRSGLVAIDPEGDPAFRISLKWKAWPAPVEKVMLKNHAFQNTNNQKKTMCKLDMVVCTLIPALFEFSVSLDCIPSHRPARAT